MIFQIEFNGTENRQLLIESRHPIYTPKRYCNWFGQLLEHAPYCERDLRVPENLETFDKKGSYLVKIKKEGVLYDYEYASHPFDVVDVMDTIIHMLFLSMILFHYWQSAPTPPVHQTFETSAFVICSFCPRLYDYHPESIPAPYNHSNIDSDEVLYYVDGDFMSRNDIEIGQITFIQQNSTRSSSGRI